MQSTAIQGEKKPYTDILNGVYITPRRFNIKRQVEYYINSRLNLIGGLPLTESIYNHGEFFQRINYE